MQWLRSFVAQSPRRALLAGKTIFLAGAILVLGAVFARASLMGINADRLEAKQPALATLAEAYPQYPTGWCPKARSAFRSRRCWSRAGMGLIVVAEEAAGRERARSAARF
ncbi:hypothetical protein HK414_22970 [Ramlibacter terrae]|uniref:Uncharacterized protein n=1 Tax=Ramlibacter terrae TaxID=2732511 RepID=A0ABX6P790_9BURK|nr:hypothetical protein HK414_22970 [Ramlibacter terrae]